MRTLCRQSSVTVFAGIAIGAGMLLGLAGWLEPARPLEFAGLILAAILTSALTMQRSTAEDRATMSPSFVIDFTSLLLFGPGATMLVAVAGTVTQALADSQRLQPYRRTLLNTVTSLAAMQTAGLAHRALGGTLGHFTWPSQGVPIAAAVLAYYLVKSASADVIAPLIARQPLNRAWRNRFLQECPTYFIGAGLAVGLVEVIDHRIWGVLPVAAVPVYFAYRAHRDYVIRLEDEQRRREVIDALDQGMSVVDSGGRVTLWNDALERILGCPRDRAMGRSLLSAVPALSNTELPRAITDACTDRSPRTLAHLGLPSAAGPRILEVKVFPVAGGVTLLWHDVTERRRGTRAQAKRRAARACGGRRE